MGGISGQQSNSSSSGQGGSQQNAANGVQVTGSGTNMKAPSMGQMQQGMGGLLTMGGMQDAMNNFFSPMVNTVRNVQDDGNQFMAKMFDTNSAKNVFDSVASNLFGLDKNEVAPSQGDAATEIIQEQQEARAPEPVAEPTPEPVVEPVVEDNGWGAVKNDNDAINWALKNGDISQQDAAWLRRWQAEANDGNNWVDGSRGTKDWDYMKSGLTNENKQIVDRFHKSVSGNWGDGKASAGAAPAAQKSRSGRGPYKGHPGVGHKGGGATVNGELVRPEGLTPEQLAKLKELGILGKVAL